MSERSLPTEPGWWWVRDADDGWRLTVALLYIDPDDGELTAEIDGERYSSLIFGSIGFEFLGPIPSPDKLARLRAAERLALAADAWYACDDDPCPPGGDDPSPPPEWVAWTARWVDAETEMDQARAAYRALTNPGGTP